jgi:hypothetical protein
MTGLKSDMSFLQVKTAMILKEQSHQVQSAISRNYREIAHMRLEAMAETGNPYSFIARVT